MKNFAKLISMMLAVVMLALAVPFAAVAKTLTTEIYTEAPSVLSEDKLLLHLDNLADTDDALIKAESTYIRSSNTWVDGNAFKSKTNGNGWRAYVIPTTLPLKSDSQYTISYTLNLPERTSDIYWGLIGFAFAGNTSSSLTLWKSEYEKGSVSSKNQLFLSRSSSGAHEGAKNAIGNYSVTNTNDFSGVHNYIISIDGTNITFYMDGVELGKLGTGLTYTESTLSVGVSTWGDYSGFANVSASNPYTMLEISNINVYDGTYEPSVNLNNYEDGQVLMKLDTPMTLNETYSYESDVENLTVESFKSTNFFGKGNTSSVDSTGDDTAYVKAQGNGSESHWFRGGVTTNLPLTSDSKYTIEFYAKNHQIGKVSLGFAFDFIDRQGSNQGVLFRKDWVTTIYGTVAGETNAGSSPVVGASSNTIEYLNLWTQYQNEEGYTRFTIEINGTQAKVYVGGGEVGSFEYGSYSGVLALSVCCEVKEALSIAPESPYVSVKDVTVWKGNVGTRCNVRFEKDGEKIGEASMAANATLETADFPVVNAAEGKLVKWFYKGTDIIVNAPYIVTNDVTLEAREIDLADIKVAGMQYTEADESGKQSIRFISSLHTLQASEAGFTVKAVYKEGDVAKVHKTWNVKSTVVYSSIKATSPSGTVSDIAANELGGTYLTALAVNGVPTDCEQIDFYVTAYLIIDGETVRSEEVRFTMSNGVSDQTLDALVVPEA